MWRFVGLCCALLLAVLSGGGRVSAWADEEPYQAVEPQPRGWPLTDAERDFVLRPEHLRRPGSEQKKHLPALWPVIPSAGHWGGTSWLDTHGKLAQHVASRPGPVDFLLVGDSSGKITVRKRCRGEAPSMAAASSTLFGMDCSPARKKRKL